MQANVFIMLSDKLCINLTAGDTTCTRTPECAPHALPVNLSRKNGGQRSSTEAPPPI